MPTTQNRIMRTYAVTLRPFTGDEPVTIEVNLSYELDGLDALDLHGHVLPADDVRAQLEAVNRLRRLAEMKRVPVGPDQIETSEWDVHLVRHTLVTIETDENGRPIRKADRS